jgi:hypothetical protein
MELSDLQRLLQRIDAVTDSVQQEFGTLSATRLNWRPQPDAWSIGQCLDHLITSNATYFTMLEQIARGTRERGLWERMPLLPSLFGALIKKGVSPNEARKTKTFDNFMPTQSDVQATIVHDFAAHQEQLKSLMMATKGVPHESVIVTSPASSFVTYSLSDCFQILTSHEERHLNQARRVTEQSDFPK